MRFSTSHLKPVILIVVSSPNPTRKPTPVHHRQPAQTGTSNRRQPANLVVAIHALCLRRAAFQGQPNNADLAFRLGAQLAETGLYGEAEWALQHSLAVQPNPATASALAIVLRRRGQSAEAEQVLTAYRYPTAAPASVDAPRIPQFTQLSPEQFATISPSMLTNQAAPQGEPARVANLPAEKQTTQEDKPGVIRNFFGSFRSVW
ncbi:MAG: hypothetical protein P8L85_12055 [Rubripirellula sp.]|nr:hypothetical protein [Rubripirellula sp.]